MVIVQDITQHGRDRGRGDNGLWNGAPEQELGELGGERMMEEVLDLRVAN